MNENQKSIVFYSVFFNGRFFEVLESNDSEDYLTYREAQENVDLENWKSGIGHLARQ